MSGADLPKPDFASNMRIIGYSDQGGSPAGVQVMVHRGHAYIGTRGVIVLDVSDPRRPRPIDHIAPPPDTMNIHLQAHDSLLLVVNAQDPASNPVVADQRAYYGRSLGELTGSAAGTRGERSWTAGLTIYDISQPARPRRIGFLPVEGMGVHRCWYSGGRWAYVSALVDGYSDYFLMIVDLADPARPREAGRFWLPGMHTAGGERPDWPGNRRYALHHAIVNGDTAYGAWRDGGLVVIDVADRSAPKLIAHRTWNPEFGSATHNCLPLPDREMLVVLDESVLPQQEDGLKTIAMFDIRDRANPQRLGTFPTPAEADYPTHPGKFGPHNLHENRPGTFVSSELIFSTFQNAGVRVFDIRDADNPVEVGALVPPKPRAMVGRQAGRPPVIQSTDVFVDSDRVIYCTDSNAGLYVMEFTG